MSIRLQVDGAAGAKGQLSEVAKGVYGIAAAEKAAEMAATKRVAAQGKPVPTQKAIGAAFRSMGSIGPAGGAINAGLAGVGAIGPIGLAIAAVALGARAIVAINDRYIAGLQSVDANVRKFSDTLTASIKDIGTRAVTRLTGKSDDEKAAIRAKGGVEAAALSQAESIQKQIEAAENARLAAGIGAMRDKLGATVSPGSASLMALNAEHEKKMESLRIARDNESVVGTTLRFWGGAFGGEGNARQQMERVTENHAAEVMLQAAMMMRDMASRQTGTGF